MLNTLQECYRKRITVVILALLLLTLAACGSSGSTTQTTNRATATGQTTTPVSGTSTPTVVASTPTSSSTATPTPQSSSSNAPSIILTPTPAPGGGQQVIFPDRVLVIGTVAQQSGVGSSTPVSVGLTVKDTGSKPIMNLATFFQLVGSEGDIFGYQSSVTPGFYGTISPQTSHSGTVVFLVPTGAMSGGLRLLYRSEIDSETVFVRLQIS